MDKKALRNLTYALAFATLLSGSLLEATPSTVYWTPCTTYFQPFMKGHIGYDTYVRDINMLPVDYGFTVGVLPFKEIQAEIGYDALLPSGLGISTQTVHYVNAKIGWGENALLPVGFAAGIFNVGFVKDVTDYNVCYAVIQKTFDNIGTFAAGGYTGNKKLLVDESGNPDNNGFMLAYTSPQFSKFIIAADYFSGKNTLSAVGGGVYIYFADNVTLLTGPVFPLAKTFVGGSNMTWTVQLDIDFDMMPAQTASK
jgi:hypothetical protein